ncbi:MAG: hypothetical protein QJR08_02725, partial [Bacillota bacterium]|nr:hypothetical protein [Bacillota bacterium]
RRDEDELRLLDQWIPVYDDYTDLRYLRAMARARQGQVIQAAADLVQAIAQGDAPVRYERWVGAGSFLALEALARINRLLGREEDARTLEEVARRRREEAA